MNYKEEEEYKRSFIENLKEEYFRYRKDFNDGETKIHKRFLVNEILFSENIKDIDMGSMLTVVDNFKKAWKDLPEHIYLRNDIEYEYDYGEVCLSYYYTAFRSEDDYLSIGNMEGLYLEALSAKLHEQYNNRDDIHFRHISKEIYDLYKSKRIDWDLLRDLIYGPRGKDGIIT